MRSPFRDSVRVRALTQALGPHDTRTSSAAMGFSLANAEIRGQGHFAKQPQNAAVILKLIVSKCDMARLPDFNELAIFGKVVERARLRSALRLVPFRRG